MLPQTRLAAAALLLFGLAPSFGAEPPAKPAPAWVIKDLGGRALNSDQFKGKVLVVDFWATWCLPCKKEIPGYIALEKKYADRGLAIVGISTDQAKPALVSDFVRKQGINYPVAIDDGSVQQVFGGLDGVPTTFVIDRSGQIRYRKAGYEAPAELEKKLVALLGP